VFGNDKIFLFYKLFQIYFTTDKTDADKKDSHDTLTRSQRSEIDAHAVIGIGATMEEERGLACTGIQVYAESRFAAQESVLHGGVLLALPSLISQGLDKLFTGFRQLPNGFYGLHHIILLLCFMALCRIQNPEQLKKHPVGEKITFSQLDENQKFDSSLNERKFFMDTIKIIAYRAETAMVNLVKKQMTNPEQACSLIRKLYTADADIEVDKTNNCLIVKIHRSNSWADDKILKYLCEQLNDTQTVFPASDLTLFFFSF
jgi:hypothetical protein